jgi:hypothetical protein
MLLVRARIPDDTIRRRFGYSGFLSHTPLLGGYDEPETLRYWVGDLDHVGRDYLKLARVS